MSTLLRRLRKVEAEMWNRSASREVRASLETLARLRKQITSEAVGPVILSPANPLDPYHPHPVGPVPPPTPSEQTSIPEIGFVPEIFVAPSPEPLV
jgi:hypothetical protein